MQTMVDIKLFLPVTTNTMESFEPKKNLIRFKPLNRTVLVVAQKLVDHEARQIKREAILLEEDKMMVS